MSGRPPLDGIRVIDFGWVWSGPMVAAILSNLGAEVIKIEHRGRLDNARLRGAPTAGPVADGPPEEISPYFHQNNSGKLSVCADIKHPDGRMIVRRLIDESDVLLENLTPGVLARAGLGWDELSSSNPRLIVLAMSAVGQDGPLSGMRAYAPVMSSLSGAESLVGYGDEPVVGMMTLGIGDPNAASHALVPLMATLIERERTGRGRFVDLSQVEAIAGVLGEAVAELQLAGADPARRGMRHPTFVPHGHYPCSGADRWIALAAGDDAEWERMADALGSPELAADERFSTAANRHQNAAALDDEVGALTARQDRDALFNRLRAARVAAAPVLGHAEASSNEHVRSRGMFQTIEHPVSGREEVTRVPWLLSATPATVSCPAPTIGQHTQDVLTRVLGMSPEEIGRHTASGALS
jgi:crotonobetainyl-CoA:carnitine CoA-transferase CaiB-like acyl-CoA transferase